MPAISNFLQAIQSTRQLCIRQRSLRRHCRLGRATELVFVLTTGVTIVLGGQAQAQTWDGQTSSNWGTATNWDNDAVPSSGDTITISGAGGINQPILDANRTASQTNVTGGTLTLPARLDSPVTVTSLGNLVVTSVGRIQGATSFAGVTGSNAGTLGGTLSVSAGTFTNSGFVDGSTTVSGGILNLNASSNLSGGQGLIVNGGQVNVNANDTVGTLSGSGGTVTVNTGATLTSDVAISDSYAGNIDGVGGFSKDGAGTTLTLSGANTHTGTMTVVRGTLALTGTTTTSVFNVGSGADLSSDGGGFAATTDINLLGNNSSLILTGDDTIGALNIDNNADVTLTGATLTLNENSVLTGTITGTGGLTINGGSTSITNTKAYTGSTSVSGGSLSITGAGTVASTVVNLSNTGTLIVDAGGLANPAAVSVGGTSTFTVNGATTVASLNQTGGTVNGNSTLTVNGAFDQSGGTTDGTVTVNAATFTQSGGGSVGFGTTVNASGLKTLSGGTIAGILDGAGATTVQNGTTMLTGTINGAVDIAGAGRLTLGTGATLNGGLTLTSGTLHAADGVILSQAVINNGAGVISAAGGETLELATLNPNSATQLTIGESGQTGTVRVNNTTSQSASATIVVNAGTLQMGGSGAASSLLSGVAGTTVNTGATVDINGFDTLVDSLSGSGNVTNNGAAAVTLRLEGTSNFDGAISNGSNAISVEVTSGNTATFSGTNTYSGTTTISAAGTLNISDNNAIADAGAVAVNGGRLEVNADERIGTLSGTAAGVVDLNANDLTVGTSATTVYAGGVEGMAGSSLVKVDSGTQTINGTVNTAGAVVVQAGTLTLSGTNTITGGITVGGAGQPATLSLQSSGAAGGATGSITTLGSVVDYAAGVNSATPITISSATTQLQVLAGSAEQSGAIGEDQAGRPLEKIGAGSLTLSGANTYSGLTTVTAGTLVVSSNTGLGTDAEGTTVVSGATLSVQGGITASEAITLNGTGVGGGGALRNLSGNNVLNGAITLGSASLINADANQVDINGGITGAFNLTVGGAGTTLVASDINTGAGTLTKDGTGVLSLNVANGFTGATTVNGGFLQVQANGALSATDLLTVNAPGVVQLFSNETVGNISGAGDIFIENNGLTLTAGNADNHTYSGVIGQNGANVGNFTKQGTGTLTLTGTNTYTGTTTVSAGVLNVTGSVAGNVIVDEGELIIGNSNAIGGTITTTGSTITYANGVDEASAMILNSTDTQLQVANAEAATQSGVISETGGARPIEKIGTGTLTLSAANTYTGATTVSAGTLIVTSGTALSDTANVDVASSATLQVNTAQEIVGSLSGVAGASVINNAGLVIAGAADTTFAGNISGAGQLTVQGGGTLTLTGANAMTGAILVGSVAGSEVAITGSGTVASTFVVAAAGGLISTDGGAFVAGTNLAVDGSTATFTGSETISHLTGNAVPNFTGTVNLTGAGTMLTLNGTGGASGIAGNVAGTGTLNVTGGTTTVAAAGNVQTATTVGAGGTVINNGTMAGVANEGTFTNNLVAGAVTNSGAGIFTNSAAATAASVESSATASNAGIVSGALTVTGGLTTNTGTVSGATTVSAGTLEQDAGTLNGLAISGAAIVNADGGTVNGAKSLTGGTLNANGASFGATPIINNGGIVNVTAATTGSVTNNIGSLNVNTGAVLTGNVINAATTTIASAAQVSGNVNNSGILNLNGAITGAPAAGNLTNTGTVNANGAVAGNVSNEAGGQFTLAPGATAAVGGTLTNASGAITTIGAASNLTASVLNQAGGTLSTAGILSGALNNAGTVTATTATVTGDVTNSSAITASGALTFGSTLNNLAAGTINAASLGVTGNATNAGSITTTGAANFATLTNSVTVTGATVAVTGLTNNSGTISSSGAMNLAGGMSGGGRLNVQGGSGDVADVITVGGAGITQGATLAFDADLSAGTSDKLVLGGAALNGTINFAFNATGANSGDNPPTIIVQDYAAGSAFNIGTVAGLPVAGGKFAYFVTDDPTNSDVVLSSVLNPGIGAIAGSVTLTQSLIGSVINRPTSPFVTGLAFDDADPCGPGVWARATGGQANASGQNESSGFISETTLSASFAGVQLGGDFACSNGSVRGWDLAAGGIGGYNRGSIALPVGVPDPTTGVGTVITSQTDAKFQQAYGGVYITAARGPLALDLQYRIEKTDLTVNNTAVGGFASLGLTNEEFSSDAKTLSGSVSYAFPIKDTNIVVVPTAGFALSRTSTDQIDFANGTDSLQLDDFANNRAFVGATVARTIFGDSETSFARQFITATYYADFAKDATSTFSFEDDADPSNANATQTITNQNLGAYGEISVGLNYVKIFDDGGAIPARQLDASIRADARFGGQLDSWGLTGQLRLQF